MKYDEIICVMERKSSYFGYDRPPSIVPVMHYLKDKVIVKRKVLNGDEIIYMPNGHRGWSRRKI